MGLVGLLWSAASTASLTALSCSLCGSAREHSLGHFISETTSKHGHSSHSSPGSCSAHWDARKASEALILENGQYFCLETEESGLIPSTSEHETCFRFHVNDYKEVYKEGNELYKHSCQNFMVKHYVQFCLHV